MNRRTRQGLRFFGKKLPSAAFNLDGEGGPVRGGRLLLVGPSEGETPGPYSYEVTLDIESVETGTMATSRRCCGETPEEALKCLEEWVMDMARLCAQIQATGPAPAQPGSGR